MNEDAYEAVKTACSWLGIALQDTANIVGWEETLELQVKNGMKNGERAAAFFKSHDPKTRLKEYGKLVGVWYNKSGWDMEVKATETELKYIIHTCPMFDGYIESGLSVEQANNICKALHRGIDKRLKMDFPTASFTSQVKKSKEDNCIEKCTVPL
jgi:hypothetical protein